MTTTLDAILVEYDAGNLTPYQAAHALASELGEVESALDPLNDERERIRAALARVLHKHGEPIELAGFGRMEIVRETMTSEYPKARIVALISALFDEGQGEIAARLARCEKQSPRRAYLLVTREKPS